MQLHFEKIGAHLRPGMQLDVVADADQLTLCHAGESVVQKFGLDPAEADYLASLWRQNLRGTNITQKFDAKKLVKLLLSLRTTDDAGLRTAIIALDQGILTLDQQVADAETQMNAVVYELYALSPEEIVLVESDISVRSIPP